MPWLAAPLPPRFWRKTVAAVQGIVLTVAASGVPGRLVGLIAVAAALLLLAESFGRDVIWLYRHGAGPRTRLALRIVIAVAAVAIVWISLVAPDRSWQYTLAAFVRIPVEALVLVAIALVLPPRPRRIVATIGGILLGLLIIDKILNIEFYENVDRAFNPVADWVSIGPAVGVVRDAIGATATDIVLVLLGIGLILLVAAITASTVHVTAVAARHRRGAVRGLAVLTAVWGLCAGLSLQLIPGFPVASTSAAGLADAQVRAAQAALNDPRRFRAGHPQPRPPGHHPRLGPADRTARQGRHHRRRRKLRAGRRPGYELLAGSRRRPATAHRLAGPGRLVRAERLAHLADLRRDQLARPLHPAVGAVGQQQPAVQRTRRQQPVHPQRCLPQGRLAHRRRRPL